MARILLLSAAGIAACDAFASPPPLAAGRTPSGAAGTRIPGMPLTAATRGAASSLSSACMQAESRRDAIMIAGAGILGLAARPSPASATRDATAPAATVNSAKAVGQAEAAIVPSLSGPVAVIGAGGEQKMGNLGAEIVASLVRRDVDVRPVVRTPRELPFMPKGGKAATKIADVMDVSTLDAAVQGAGAVVFSVSPSRRTTETSDGTESEIGTLSGTTPMDVFTTGLANVAKACVRNNVPRLVVISRSGCTEKSDSSEICGAELIGEDAVKDIYRQANLGKREEDKLSYTIARAGTLLSGMRRGPADVELNQGDTLSGYISRPDMADLVSDMLATGKGEMATFEAMYKDTANPTNFVKSLESCMESGRSLKQCAFGDENEELPNLSEVMAGKVAMPTFNLDMNIKTVLKGDSWPSMLDGLKRDAEIDMDIEEFGVQRG